MDLIRRESIDHLLSKEAYRQYMGRAMARVQYLQIVREKIKNEIPVVSLNTLRDEIYQDAVEHGLWEENEKWPVTCATRISDEADELMDAGVDWEDEGFDLDGPDQAYSEELADVVIMCMSVAGALGIDIDAAIRRKMEINKQRPWKHGKGDA